MFLFRKYLNTPFLPEEKDSDIILIEDDNISLLLNEVDTNKYSNLLALFVPTKRYSSHEMLKEMFYDSDFYIVGPYVVGMLTNIDIGGEIILYTKNK